MVLSNPAPPNIHQIPANPFAGQLKAGADDEAEKLATEKLGASGLTKKQGLDLGMTWHDAATTITFKTGMEAVPSLCIPYFEIDGKTPAKARPDWPDFFRLRALRQPIPLPDDWSKYRQPEGSGMRAYFPRVVHKDLIGWPAIAAPASTKKASVPLYITEGELKAAKACVEGFATIGLGGVDSFQSRDLGVDFLPELDAVAWARRRVYIVFDSDVVRKPDVARALWALACRLRDRGALPYLVTLPEMTDDDGVSKTGLDDYLVINGADMLEDLILRTALPLTTAFRAPAAPSS